MKEKGQEDRMRLTKLQSGPTRRKEKYKENSKELIMGNSLEPLKDASLIQKTVT
jgi:hypothetical protein